MLKIILANTVNYVVADEVPLTWDEARLDRDGLTSPSGFWDVSSPDRLVCTRDVPDARVEVHLTTLGGDGGTVNYYGGYNNSTRTILVVKNWDGTSHGAALLPFVVAAKVCQGGTGLSAEVDDLNQSIGDERVGGDDVLAGDIFQVMLQSATGNLLVEANPSTPPIGGYPGNYRGRPGTGRIGTHLVLRGT